MTPAIPFTPSRRRVGRIAALLAAACALATSSCHESPAGLPVGRIKHVFVIVLENENSDTTFGATTEAPYLANTLRSQGAYLSEYYGIGHLSLTNYVAMISGQGPSAATQGDCNTYADFVQTGSVDADGQIPGTGCVYPATVKTLANQLTDAGLTWRGYMEDMGNDAANSPTTCRHPAIGAVDNTQAARLGDEYATRHNPFVYFHSIIDTPDCAANDVPLTELETDLASASTTASFSFITPNLCNDGHDHTCVDGSAGGLSKADAFLQLWVPRILNSAAYQDGGLLIITFDEAETFGDQSACCDELPGANVMDPGLLGPGGGRVGAVVLSPLIEPGTVSDRPYNHYSLLRTIEDLFHLDHLGYAGRPGLKTFGSDVF